MLSGIAPLIS